MQCFFKKFGQPVTYPTGLLLQEAVSTRLKTSPHSPDFLLLLQHNPTFTIGKHNFNYDKIKRKLENTEATFYQSNRGGNITFHGPGQLIAYPIINLKRNPLTPGIKPYVDLLQRTLISTCHHFSIPAITTKDTGVWVTSTRKIAAIGIKVSRYITSHGFAINCCTDLKWFDLIDGCGLKGKEMTSLTKELMVDGNKGNVEGVQRVESVLGVEGVLGVESVQRVEGVQRVPKVIEVDEVAGVVVDVFGSEFGYEMVELKVGDWEFDQILNEIVDQQKD